MKPTIGIFTTFYRIDPGYSLCAVVLDQLRALTKYGYKTVLFVLPSFNDEDQLPAGVEVRKIVPQLILEPYKEFGFPSYWKEDVQKAKEMIEKNCQDIDFLICHDVFFIDTFLPYNIALREASIKAQYLAWTHSAPSDRAVLEDNPHANRYTLPQRTRLVYLNNDKVINLAEMYGAWPKDVRVVHNSRDPRSFWNLDSFTNNLIDRYDIFAADIISVYPLSTPRMISGKGLDKVILIHSELKKLGLKTRLIVCNAHANAQRDKAMIADTRVWAAGKGLTHEELIFTSLEEVPTYELGVPQKIVSDLFRISNLFVFPTISENSSLVLLEAMLAGNLLVLNETVGTLREHAGPAALYFNLQLAEAKEKYWQDIARIILSEFERSRSHQVKALALQKNNFDYVFKHEIEILFSEYEVSKTFNDKGISL